MVSSRSPSPVTSEADDDVRGVPHETIRHSRFMGHSPKIFVFRV